jgi:hypothetical protein
MPPAEAPIATKPSGFGLIMIEVRCPADATVLGPPRAARVSVGLDQA